MTPDDFDMENAPSPQPVAQRIPEQPQRGERTAEPFSAGEGLRRQVRENVEAFGGSRHRFGDQLARERRHQRAMARKAMRLKDVPAPPDKIGSASGRERVCQYV